MSEHGLLDWKFAEHMQIYRKFLALGSQRIDRWCLMEKCLLFRFCVTLSPVSHTSTTWPTADFKGPTYRYVPCPCVPSKPCGWPSPWESSPIQAAPMPTCNLGSCKYLSHSSLVCMWKKAHRVPVRNNCASVYPHVVGGKAFPPAFSFLPIRCIVKYFHIVLWRCGQYLCAV